MEKDILKYVDAFNNFIPLLDAHKGKITNKTIINHFESFGIKNRGLFYYAVKTGFFTRVGVSSYRCNLNMFQPIHIRKIREVRAYCIKMYYQKRKDQNKKKEYMRNYYQNKKNQNLLPLDALEIPTKFIKPNIVEVAAYCKERGNSIDPCRFMDFYESKGWMVGKNKMKDWRGAIRTWERNVSAPAQKIIIQQEPQTKKEVSLFWGLIKINL